MIEPKENGNQYNPMRQFQLNQPWFIPIYCKGWSTYVDALLDQVGNFINGSTLSHKPALLRTHFLPHRKLVCMLGSLSLTLLDNTKHLSVY